MPSRQIRKSRSPVFAAVGALALVVILVIAGIELAREFDRARNHRAEATRSFETRSQIQRVFSLMQDAETGQRGYIITGDDRFLEPYHAANATLAAQLTMLRRQMAQDRSQTADIAELERDIARKRQILARTIDLRRRLGPAAASAEVSEGEGKAAMDDIRRVVSRMVDREAGHLEQARVLAETRTRRTEWMVSSLFFALMVLTLGGGFLLWRYLTTRQALLATVSANAARQEAILDSAIDTIITLNPSGSIESINRAGRKMFGYTAAELDRRDISLLIDLAGDGGGDAPFLTRLGEKLGALESGRLVREMSGRRKDGSTFPVDVALGAMEQPTGIHVVAIVRDISERRRIEEMKDEFVSTVSHELRTPMTSVAGSLGLLAGGAAGELPEKAVRLIAIAQANSQRLVRLINDILDIEKIESGKLSLASETLNLRDIAERSIEGVRGYSESLGVELRLAEEHDAPVRGDADRLIQVVTNLLSNAAKFSPQGGEVLVSVLPERRLARLSVRDFGPGIPEGFRSRIFSKFAQADGSDSRTQGGTGLGLAISREIAERHGGRLWFESAPGEGATFHLDLPLMTETGPSSAEGPKLLIVEDDLDAAHTLRDLMERDGFQADIVGTADAAYRAAVGDGYSALLVDLNLPDGDGIGLIRSLRDAEQTRDIPIIVISGDAARGKARGAALEVLDWMDKPINGDRLRHVVAGAMGVQAERPRVLHVEDDVDVLSVVSSTLGGVADVEAARTLSDARQSLSRSRPDLVILDLGLPDGSGLDLLKDLTDASGRAIPVVVYSAQDMDGALKTGVDAVLTKSRASLTTLTRTVRRLTIR
ncbi:CHASE3 domain-containing protein [Brevundimonas sp. NPDC092305]|uniref:CHASE3 domain-containing protein n=1 Tax=Brevundimonas sp. NPDC092305 TaxID=3363957 RepID=UPI0037F2F0AF